MPWNCWTSGKLCSSFLHKFLPEPSLTAVPLQQGKEVKQKAHVQPLDVQGFWMF